MSTLCRIGILTETKSVISIYCNWDGGLAYTGVHLIEHYNNIEKIKALLNLGNIAIIGERLEPSSNKPHTLQNSQDNVVVAYHRDGGGKLAPAEVSQTVDTYVTKCRPYVEYFYLFDPITNIWYYFKPLTPKGNKRKTIHFNQLAPAVKKISIK